MISGSYNGTFHGTIVEHRIFEIVPRLRISQNAFFFDLPSSQGLGIGRRHSSD